MPQGKGTYGSKVGRPPKKKAEGYMGGGKVEGYNREVVADAVRRRRAHTRKRKEAIKELEKKWRKEASAKAVKKSVENAKKQMKTRKENEKFLKEFGYEPEKFNEGGMVMEPEEYEKGGKVKGLKKWLREKTAQRRLKKAYKKEGKKLVEEGKLKKGSADKYATTKAKEEAPKSGKIRRGAIADKSTKTREGGEFVKYKKGSGAAKSFREAFADARKAGKKTFTWDGRSYAAVTKEDMAKKKSDAKPKQKYSKESRLEGFEKFRQEDNERRAKESAKADAKEPVKKEDKKTWTSKDRLEDTQSRLKFSEGGKVPNNPYGWPTTDARGNKG